MAKAVVKATTRPASKVARKMRIPLKTIASAIEALGGPRVVSRDCCCRVECVYDWVRHDSIPPGWHMRMYVQLRALGYEPCLVGVFGFTERMMIRKAELEAGAVS